MSPIDDEIEGLFADLRAENAARAPRFSLVRAAAEQRVAARKRPAHVSGGWWLAAAATLVIAAAILTRQLRHGDEAIDASIAERTAYPSIESWTPPTDALLRHAHVATTVSPATFGSAVDDLATSHPYK